MQSSIWERALAGCADPARARQSLAKLGETEARGVLRKLSAESARVLACVLGGSQALGELLLARPDWVNYACDLELIRHPRQAQGLRRELQAALQPLLERRDVAGARAALQEFKQREMLRIAARDLARLGRGAEITEEITSVADVCVQAVFDLCWRQLTERAGRPFHLTAEGRWAPTGFCVLGLGKFGGRELNYSSDIDVMFLYTEEGEVFPEPPGEAPPRRSGGLPNHRFFRRLAEAIVAEISGQAGEGPLFRIDVRLRPEGDTGPLARSLSSCENYYAQWGQTWERMMLIKARGVAGDPPLAAEFLETINPFRYPRAVSPRILQEIAAVKQRIESEVVRAGELDRNVKLGRGGIREIEFITQTLQVLHAGRQPFLQESQTLAALERLRRYEFLPGSIVEGLREAYLFLRDVEHRLQMENNLQTHTIPTERKARARLARLMGFESVREFEAARERHCRLVREAFEHLLQAQPAETRLALPRRLDRDEDHWKRLLREHGFRDADRALHIMKSLAHGPGYVHVSERTTELATELFGRLLDWCPKHDREPGTRDEGQGPKAETNARRLPAAAPGPATRNPTSPEAATSPPAPPPAAFTLSDPDRVLARLDSFVAAYGARAVLFETWVSNPPLFAALVRLFDRSEFLAELAIRTPDLVEELELSGQLRRRKTAAEILCDLRHGRDDEDQLLWLRRYHQVELMRIGLRDILELADFEQSLVELTALADACLQYALEIVMRRRRLKKPPFAIIGLGKLGGAELNFGSDLDITFVAEAKAKDLSRLLPLAAEVLQLLSAPTQFGVAFVTDARLRPDGEKGLLVNTLTAYDEYYHRRAHLWEVQALTRTRPVAGDAKLGEAFQTLAGELTDWSRPRPDLAAYAPDWRQRIAHMRARIEKERTPPGKDALAFKTGAGGLIDAEFIAQTLCLAHGWQEANTLQALQRARATGALPQADADALIDNFRRLRRMEGVLRRWSYAGESLLPDDPAPLYRVAVRCGFQTSDEFLRAVGQWRAAIRAVYARVCCT